MLATTFFIEPRGYDEFRERSTRAIPSSKQEDGFLKGVKDCIPTLLGYLSIGLAAGVVQKTAGLSIAEIALISLILYAGSAQFIAAGMIAVSSSPAAIIITIFIVNLRHILLSAALSPYFRHLTPLRNMLVGSLLTDETFGVAINQTLNKERISEQWMHGLNITAYLNWFLANIAGAFWPSGFQIRINSVCSLRYPPCLSASL